ncbi:Oxidation resistance protein (ISS) [Phytophthora palmivora]|uniref:Oxidation resistance protein (ISS) n=1 Tax=Phytophthora palmivora TaxID=4796 RepID=A0A2P4XC27_9STRA|nr:Oxidation resistance protein (ISS) [Phytophthora palmivora]
MVVQDEHQNIFGAFCPASWKRSKTFFGNGRTFVFSLSPHMNAYMWSGIDSSFMYTRRDSIFVGGGNKGIALCLQLDDRRGFTHACTTFDSPPLVDYQSFRCETIEVWSFHGLKV